MRIAVYCGSTAGTDPAFSKEAVTLGKAIANGGHTLVYGGGKVGLMGLVSDAVLSKGGTVIGVIPHFLATTEQMHTGVTEMIRVDNMSERKNKMIELADAFVALPGGPGTVEEIAEIISHKRLGLLTQPCFLLSVNGFYNAFEQHMVTMTENGFYPEDCARHVKFVKNTAEIFENLSDAFC